MLSRSLLPPAPSFSFEMKSPDAAQAQSQALSITVMGLSQPDTGTSHEAALKSNPWPRQTF